MFVLAISEVPLCRVSEPERTKIVASTEYSQMGPLRATPEEVACEGAGANERPPFTL